MTTITRGDIGVDRVVMTTITWGLRGVVMTTVSGDVITIVSGVIPIMLSTFDSKSAWED